ncbi:transglutaminase family protein [Frateuria aurantia]
MLKRYEVTHDTIYHYDAPVALSQQQLHLTPRELPRQQVLQHRLEISPAPSQRLERLDAFGNPLTLLEFNEPHDSLGVRSHMVVEVQSMPWPASSPPWEKVSSLLQFRPGVALDASLLEATRFRFESTFGRIKSDFAGYAGDCFQPGRPLLEAVAALNHKIHKDVRFQPGATTVSTPVVEVLRCRRGVCQDLAHLMIACLRSMGLAARYISGYILTTPPPGQPRMVGADASHAWVAVWCPGLDGGQWLEFDPTNDLQPGHQHVTLGWGRDFADISPLRGMIHGGGTHELSVAVTMRPLDELALQN